MSTTTMGEEIRIGPIAVRFLVEAEATGGSAALFEFDVPAGVPTPPPHSHDAYEETLYGLSGTLTWDGGRTSTTAVGPGEVLTIPRGRGAPVRERRRRDGDAARRGDARAARAGLLPRARRDRRRADGPPDVQALMAVMRRHGLSPRPPASRRLSTVAAGW